MRDPPVDPRPDERRARGRRDDGPLFPKNGHPETVGRPQIEKVVDAPQVGPEQLVEIAVVRRGMVVAVPPAPVAPLGRVDRPPGLFPRRGSQARFRLALHQNVARRGEPLPCEIVLLVPDPDLEVVVDPRSREDRREGFGGRVLSQIIRYGRRDDPVFPFESAVQRPEEWNAVLRIELPGVLPVEDDRNDRRADPAGARGPDGPEAGDEIVGRFLGRPSGVREPDQVGENVVPEDHGDSGRTLDGPVRAVEALGRAHETVPVPLDRKAERTRKDLLVRRHP